ncbi:hypothetical protein IJI86_01910 [Candidatus Saccharibacteria bacterium]|nr:hypothetical protein [Candidatus Saccharibacteria bacterium]
MKIVIPESNDPIIKEAADIYEDVSLVPARDLNEAANLVNAGAVDTMISGFNYSTRDVILCFKENFKMTSEFFSSCFICSKNGQNIAIADGGVNKDPTKEQLYCIVEDTAKTFQKCFNDQPRIAMLSYSTNGSGGKNPDLEKIYFVISKIRQNHPEWLIDGEMQLDTAMSHQISEKKFPNSAIQGHANILIVPDLNSGNILYKSLEYLGGWRVAGPIVQGFDKPLADLSRGSTVDNVSFTIKIIERLYGKR